MKVFTEKAQVKITSEMLLLFGLIEEYPKENEFSYNLKADMKIDVEATRKKLAERESKKIEAKKEFEELQK